MKQELKLLLKTLFMVDVDSVIIKIARVYSTLSADGDYKQVNHNKIDMLSVCLCTHP